VRDLLSVILKRAKKIGLVNANLAKMLYPNVIFHKQKDWSAGIPALSTACRKALRSGLPDRIIAPPNPFFRSEAQPPSVEIIKSRSRSGKPDRTAMGKARKSHHSLENHVNSRKLRHIAKTGVSIWLAVCYGEADITQFRIEK